MSTTPAGTAPEVPTETPQPPEAPEAPTPTPAPPPPAPAPPAPSDQLGDAGKKAIEAERKRAEKAEAELAKVREGQLSDQQKLEQRATKGDERFAAGTAKVRRANLMLTLSEPPYGLVGGRARAAARLLDKVEYNDDDEPQQLDEAITAAKAEFGEELFKPGAMPASGATPESTPETPDLHQGARPLSEDMDEGTAMRAIQETYWPELTNAPDPLRGNVPSQ